MAALVWTRHVELASKQAAGWRSAAAASAVLCIGLGAALSMTIGGPAVAVHVFEVDRMADVPASDGRSSVAALIDGRDALEPVRRAKGPPWRSPGIMGTAFAPSKPTLRPSPTTLASNVRAQR
jgi:hypothetical protein